MTSEDLAGNGSVGKSKRHIISPSLPIKKHNDVERDQQIVYNRCGSPARVVVSNRNGHNFLAVDDANVVPVVAAG